MAALVLAGATCWSIAKGRRKLVVASALAFILVVATLLLSKSRGGLVEIRGGLAAGDRVVVHPDRSLEHGGRVRLR